MIILDAEEKERYKQLHDSISGPTLRFPEKAASRSDSSLPDYETSEAHQKLIVKEFLARPKGIETKLWRAILYSLGIYILLTLIIGVPILVVKKRESNNVPMDQGPAPDHGPFGNLYSSIEGWDDGEYAKCGSDRFELIPSPNHTAHAEYNLTYSDTFYIRSNISHASRSFAYPFGHLEVDFNPDPLASKALFTVDVVASSDDLLRHTTACFIDSDEDSGVLFFMTRSLYLHDHVTVHIRLLLPQSPSSAGFDNLVTDLPWFRHTFGDLKNHQLKNVVISGSYSDVSAGSLKASFISVKNSYASIIGDFHATSSLTLDGIKGNISANITLEQLNSSKEPTSLLLDNGDGSIDANVILVAPPKSHRNSPSCAFSANVQAFKGPVTFHARHTNSTPPTPLQLTITNADGPTNVLLDKKFEGNLSAQSKLGDVKVRKLNVSQAMDPRGKRRQYTYNFSQSSNNSITGWVGWGKNYDDITRGQVKIMTSLSDITLQLGTP